MGWLTGRMRTDMTKQEILDKFNDINFAYNDSSKHETLSKMLNELLKEQEAVEPLFNEQMKHFVCPNCSLVLDEGRDDYCPSCGKGIAWDEYYIHENETEGR